MHFSLSCNHKWPVYFDWQSFSTPYVFLVIPRAKWHFSLLPLFDCWDKKFFTHSSAGLSPADFFCSLWTVVHCHWRQSETPVNLGCSFFISLNSGRAGVETPDPVWCWAKYQTGPLYRILSTRCCTSQPTKLMWLCVGLTVRRYSTALCGLLKLARSAATTRSLS